MACCLLPFRLSYPRLISTTLPVLSGLLSLTFQVIVSEVDIYDLASIVWPAVSYLSGYRIRGRYLRPCQYCLACCLLPFRLSYPKLISTTLPVLSGLLYLTFQVIVSKVDIYDLASIVWPAVSYLSGYRIQS